ncbi:MAG: TetR/AcrR family transcriptional regulator [Mycobacteriales bacterium]
MKDSQPAKTGPRMSDRATVTRHAILEAAREVFTSSGFSDANIADVVAGAGASVGSLYHHFGGKGDLYLALFEEYQARQEALAAAAVSAAKDAGETDRIALFVSGARAYLDGCWTERELTRLFLTGGGPAGFELVARRRYRDWTRLNEILLLADGEPENEALVLVLTAIVSEAGSEVAVAESEERASRLAESVLGLIARIGTPS